MSVEKTQKYCKACEKNVLAERKGTNHILHFLITVVLGIFTMGIGAVIWIIIWILLTIKIGGWKCSQCGSSKLSSPH